MLPVQNIGKFAHAAKKSMSAPFPCEWSGNIDACEDGKKYAGGIGQACCFGFIATKPVRKETSRCALFTVHSYA